jgi:hypothetical protein
MIKTYFAAAFLNDQKHNLNIQRIEKLAVVKNNKPDHSLSSKLNQRRRVFNQGRISIPANKMVVEVEHHMKLQFFGYRT